MTSDKRRVNPLEAAAKREFLAESIAKSLATISVALEDLGRSVAEKADELVKSIEEASTRINESERNWRRNRVAWKGREAYLREATRKGRVEK